MHSSSAVFGTRMTGLEGSEVSKNIRLAVVREIPPALYTYMAPINCRVGRGELQLRRKATISCTTQ